MSQGHRKVGRKGEEERKGEREGRKKRRKEKEEWNRERGREFRLTEVLLPRTREFSRITLELVLSIICYPFICLSIHPLHLSILQLSLSLSLSLTLLLFLHLFVLYFLPLTTSSFGY